MPGQCHVTVSCIQRIQMEQEYVVEYVEDAQALEAAVRSEWCAGLLEHVILFFEAHCRCDLLWYVIMVGAPFFGAQPRNFVGASAIGID